MSRMCFAFPGRFVVARLSAVRRLSKGGVGAKIDCSHCCLTSLATNLDL